VAYPVAKSADADAEASTTTTAPTPNPNDPKNPPTPTPTDPAAGQQGSSGEEVVKRCVANAVRSPILWAVPLALLGQFGGKLIEPYVGQFQAQLNEIDAELNRQWREATRSNDRDWGWGGNGGNRDRNNQNEAFNELMARVNAANAQLQQIANSPEVQMAGKILAGIAGIAAVSALLYDWCTTDPGKAWTSIDFEGGSSIDAKKNAPRYGKDAKPTTVAPTTVTEPTTSPVNESK